MTTTVTDLSLTAKSTRWGSALVGAAITQRPLDYVANSTYNEHLDVLPLDHIGTNKIPVIKYIGMGIGSDYMTSIIHPLNGAVIDNPTKYIHSNEDAIPFLPFPYIMRVIGEDDLSITERAKFAMRGIIEINDVSYAAYYLKQAEATNDKVTIEVVTTDTSGNVTDVSALEPSTAPLTPVRDTTFSGESDSTNEYLQIRSTLTLSLSPADVSEILNCAAIMFGVNDIEITEFAMVGGIDVTSVVVDGNSNISYTEAIGAQTTHFSPVSFSAAQRLDVGIDIEFKLGQSLAMA